MLPLVGSMIACPRLIRPSRSAASIMARPMRSFTLHKGLKLSALATTVVVFPLLSWRRRIRGVLPMHLVTSP